MNFSSTGSTGSTGSTLRRCAALAAAFGIALQALLPAIAQAQPGNTIQVPICSVDGTRHSIDLDLGRNESGKGSEHCKLCLQGTDKPVVWIAPALPLLSFAARHESAVARQKPALKSSALATAHPRAPPFAS